MILGIDEALREIRVASREDYLARRPNPAIALILPTADRAMSDSDQALSSTLEDEGFGHLLAAEAGCSSIAWLDKSERNIFGNIISLGRAPSNDVQLPFETISKVHAVFTCVGDSWRLSDRSARNGLFVNGRRVEESATVDLQDGDRLRFGSKIEGTFYSAEALHEFLIRLT